MTASGNALTSGSTSISSSGGSTSISGSGGGNAGGGGLLMMLGHFQTIAALGAMAACSSDLESTKEEQQTSFASFAKAFDTFNMRLPPPAFIKVVDTSLLLTPSDMLIGNLFALCTVAVVAVVLHFAITRWLKRRFEWKEIPRQLDLRAAAIPAIFFSYQGITQSCSDVLFKEDDSPLGVWLLACVLWLLITIGFPIALCVGVTSWVSEDRKLRTLVKKTKLIPVPGPTDTIDGLATIKWDTDYDRWECVEDEEFLEIYGAVLQDYHGATEARRGSSAQAVDIACCVPVEKNQEEYFWKGSNFAETKAKPEAESEPELESDAELPDVADSTETDDVQLWSTIPHAMPAAQLTATWHDQGSGNQKGNLYARKAGGDWVQLTDSPAPHSPSEISVDLPASVLGSGSCDVGYTVGGGGGHEINIFGARLVFSKSPKNTKSIDGRELFNKATKFLDSAPGNILKSLVKKMLLAHGVHLDALGKPVVLIHAVWELRSTVLFSRVRNENSWFYSGELDAPDLFPADQDHGNETLHDLYAIEHVQHEIASAGQFNSDPVLKLKSLPIRGFDKETCSMKAQYEDTTLTKMSEIKSQAETKEVFDKVFEELGSLTWKMMSEDETLDAVLKNPELKSSEEFKIFAEKINELRRNTYKQKVLHKNTLLAKLESTAPFSKTWLQIVTQLFHLVTIALAIIGCTFSLDLSFGMIGSGMCAAILASAENVPKTIEDMKGFIKLLRNVKTTVQQQKEAADDRFMPIRFENPMDNIIEEADDRVMSIRNPVIEDEAMQNTDDDSKNVDPKAYD